MSEANAVSPDDLSIAVLRDRAHGQSIRAIARARNLTVSEVEKLIDEAANRALSGEEQRREIACETVRLGDLKLKYFKQANEQIDVASAAVYTKLCERLASMLGQNAPQSHAVQLSTRAAPRELTSTEQLRAAITRLKGQKPGQEGESAARANGG